MFKVESFFIVVISRIVIYIILKFNFIIQNEAFLY